MYKREKNREKDSCRSGAGFSAGKTWKYMAVMGFLAPFLEFRETSGNMTLSSHVESQVADLPACYSQPDPTAASQEHSEPASQFYVVTTTPSTSTPQGSAGRKRARVDPFEERMLASMERFQPPPPADEDELYFRSLIPALKRLPLHKRGELKLKFYAMVVEAEREEELQNNGWALSEVF